ncbi:MAG: hypothetical protein EOO65_02995 [Methanosarcinales archaeon]|nr:MAG: hypothetical protein EOO65_02995 [Methanosarcinales archaeon]
MVANSIYLSYHPTTASELADNSYQYGPGFALTVVATLMALVQHVLMNFDDDATVAVPARMPITSSSVATNVDDVNASSYQAAP